MTTSGIEPATFRFVAQHLNPLNAELNPICHLLALLGAHHIFHVSGLRVNRCAAAVPTSKDSRLFNCDLQSQLRPFVYIQLSFVSNLLLP